MTIDNSSLFVKKGEYVLTFHFSLINIRLKSRTFAAQSENLNNLHY